MDEEQLFCLVHLSTLSASYSRLLLGNQSPASPVLLSSPSAVLLAVLVSECFLAVSYSISTKQLLKN